MAQLDLVELIRNTNQTHTVKESEAGSCIEEREESEGDTEGEEEEERFALRCLTDAEEAQVHEVLAHSLININYFHYDNLDSVKAITNNVGELVGLNYYDAFGNAIIRPEVPEEGAEADAETEGGAGFGGHEAIVGTNLVHMNGRIYDPKIGRFVSADPFVPAFGEGQALNRYSYVYNNPLRYIDPSGYKPVAASQHERNEYIFVSLAYFELEIVLPSNAHLYDLLKLSRNDRATFEQHIQAWGATPEAFDRATPFIDSGYQSAVTAIKIREAKREAKYLAIVQVIITVATYGASSTSWLGSTWYAAPLLNAGAQLAITGDLDAESFALSLATAYIGAGAGQGGFNESGFFNNLEPFQQTTIQVLANATVRGFASHLGGGEFEHGFAAGVFEAVLNEKFLPGFQENGFQRIVRSGLIEGLVTEVANETRDGEKLDFFDGFQLGVLRQGATEAGIRFGGDKTSVSCNSARLSCNLSPVGDVLNLIIEDGDTYSILNGLVNAAISIHGFRVTVGAFIRDNEHTTAFQIALHLERSSGAFIVANDGKVLTSDEVESNEEIDLIIEAVEEYSDRSVVDLSTDDVSLLVRSIGGVLYDTNALSAAEFGSTLAGLMSGNSGRFTYLPESFRGDFERDFRERIEGGDVFRVSENSDTGLKFIGDGVFAIVDPSLEADSQIVGMIAYDDEGNIEELSVSSDATDLSYLPADRAEHSNVILGEMDLLARPQNVYLPGTRLQANFTSNSDGSTTITWGAPDIESETEANKALWKFLNEDVEFLKGLEDGWNDYADGLALRAIKTDNGIYFVAGAGVAVVAAFIPTSRLEAGLTVAGVIGKGVSRVNRLVSSDTTRVAATSIDDVVGRLHPNHPLKNDLIERNGDRLLLNQGTAPTCAHTSCSLVLDTIGKQVDPADLISLIPPGADGIALPAIRSLFASRGIKSSYKSNRTVDDLADLTSDGTPVIARIAAPNFGGHAVVVDGVTTKLGVKVVAIRDPQGVQYFSPVTTFEKYFKGQIVVPEKPPKL